MKSTRLIILLAVVVLVLIAMAVVGKKQGWIGQGNLPEVETEKVAERAILETVSASGKIFPEVEVKISSDVSGELIELPIEKGGWVTQGQLLARIKPDIYLAAVDRAAAALSQARANLANAKARLAQAKARFENARLTFNRNKALHDKGIVSDAEFETIQMNFATAEADFEAAKETVKGADYSVQSAAATLKEARDNLAKTEIYAPMSGTVSLLNVEQGERIVGTLQMAGTELMRIADLNNMEVRVDVSENDVLRVSTGDTAEIEVDAYLDRAFLGRVTHIAHSSNQTDILTSEQVTNFTVKIKLLHVSYQDLISKNGHRYPFRPGMSAVVDIFTEQVTGALAVPIQAVTVRQDIWEQQDTTGREPDLADLPEIVFLYDPATATVQVREVETGIQDATHIHIIEGLELDDQIVTGPYRAIAKTLKAGDAVQLGSADEAKEAGLSVSAE